MKRKYISITIDDGHLYLIKGYEAGETIVVDEAYIDKRDNNETIETMLRMLMNKTNLDDCKISIAMKAPYRTNYVQLPVMNQLEIMKMLSYQESKYIKWKGVEFYTQFLWRTPSNEINDKDIMDLFLIALEKSVVRRVGMAVWKANGILEIISFWPGEIVFTYKNNHYLTLIVDCDVTKICYWSDTMLLWEKEVESNPKAVAVAIENMKEEYPNWTIEGIEILKMNLKQEITNTYDWQAIEEHFGKLEKEELHILPNVNRIIDRTQISWEATLGGLIRSIRG